MSKYYTPTIEEFHVGFEFEILSTQINDKWTKRVFRENNRTVYILHAIRRIRVKYLDQDDIESFGWLFRCASADRTLWMEFVNNDGYVLTLSRNGHVNIKQSNTADFIVFNGKIKNKSELKRVLEQVGVI